MALKKKQFAVVDICTQKNAYHTLHLYAHRNTIARKTGNGYSLAASIPQASPGQSRFALQQVTRHPHRHLSEHTQLTPLRSHSAHTHAQAHQRRVSKRRSTPKPCTFFHLHSHHPRHDCIGVYSPGRRAKGRDLTWLGGEEMVMVVALVGT